MRTMFLCAAALACFTGAPSSLNPRCPAAREPPRDLPVATADGATHGAPRTPRTAHRGLATLLASVTAAAATAAPAEFEPTPTPKGLLYGDMPKVLPAFGGISHGMKTDDAAAAKSCVRAFLPSRRATAAPAASRSACRTHAHDSLARGVNSDKKVKREGEETYEFQAEVNRLMDIIINSLYQVTDSAGPALAHSRAPAAQRACRPPAASVAPQSSRSLPSGAGVAATD